MSPPPSGPSVVGVSPGDRVLMMGTMATCALWVGHVVSDVTVPTTRPAAGRVTVPTPQTRKPSLEVGAGAHGPRRPGGRSWGVSAPVDTVSASAVQCGGHRPRVTVGPGSGWLAAEGLNSKILPA